MKKFRHPFHSEHAEIYRYMVEMGICTACRLRWAEENRRLCTRCRKYINNWTARKAREK